MPAVRRSFRHSPFRCSPWFTLLAVLAFQISTASAKPVMMAAGDVIADIMVPEADGIMGAGGIAKAIGFDGQYLYYAEYAGNVLHRIDVPPPGTSWATGHIDIPIQGAPSGIMTISYDARRGGFWAVGGDGVSIYLLSKTGVATPVFWVDPINDRPGDCKRGCVQEVKINYDGTDDTIWYAPDTTYRIYHYRTTPDALGTAQLVDSSPFIDVDIPPNDMSQQCGYSLVSGVAVGGSSLFITVSGCPYYYEFSKTGTKLGFYPEQPPSSGDWECDNIS